MVQLNQQQQHYEQQEQPQEQNETLIGIADESNHPTHAEGSNNNNNNDNNENERDQLYIQQWKESPFAVGITYPTWDEEIQQYYIPGCCCCYRNDRNRHRNRPNFCFKQSTANTSIDNPFHHSINVMTSDTVLLERMQSSAKTTKFTSLLCSWTPFSRVGNMIIVFQYTPKQQQQQQSTSNNNNTPQQQQQRAKPKLLLVLGPYWMVFLFVTLPFFIGLAIVTGIFRIHENTSIVLKVVWATCNVTLIVALVNVSCRNPGILYRYSTVDEIPHDTIDRDEWVWNDQALSYRPKKARYDNDCACIIDGFDHVCPWTGTAIGHNNMFWFRVFVTFVVVTILFDVFLLVFYRT